MYEPYYSERVSSPAASCLSDRIGCFARICSDGNSPVGRSRSATSVGNRRDWRVDCLYDPYLINNTGVLPDGEFIPVRMEKGWRRRGGKVLPVVLLFVCLASPAWGEGNITNREAPARVISLEEALSIAMQNHPRLKTASAAIDRSRASRGESWEPAPMSVSYSWGQINGETRNDNQIEVTQSLGSLLTPFYKNTLVNKRIATGEYYRDLVKKKLLPK